MVRISITAIRLAHARCPGPFAVGDTVCVADPKPPTTPACRVFAQQEGHGQRRVSRRVRYFVSTGPDGDGPQHVYRVSFDAADIWGADKSEPNTSFTPTCLKPI